MKTEIPTLWEQNLIYRQILERDKINTSIIDIHDRFIFWLGTDTSIKSVGLHN
jgi:hypothetical protein